MTYPQTAGFQSHSATSRDAAENLTTQHSMEGKILAFMEAYQSGWTGDELQEMLIKDFPTVQTGTIAARLRGLELKKLIVKTSEVRKTRNNRDAYVWKHPKHVKPHEALAPQSETSINNEAVRELAQLFYDALKLKPDGGAVINLAPLDLVVVETLAARAALKK